VGGQLSMKKQKENTEKGLPYNSYGYYPAQYCRDTGLPMYDKLTYKPYIDKYLSKTRCREIGKPIKDKENPVAFYRVDHGYCGLYDRNNELN
jgi:hypothetical protein